MLEWLNTHCFLLLCILGTTLVTVLPKILPITFLKGDSLPKNVVDWLSFVPVAVMAALVGPDVVFYEGSLNLTTENLFLVVAIPLLVVAWFAKNYFVTIAVGMAMVILARGAGWY